MKRIIMLAVGVLALLTSCREIRDLNYYANGYVDRVTLNTNKIDLVLGEDAGFQLEATVSPVTAPNRKVIWTSADWTVAEVNDNGYVTPKAAGETVVTVRTDDGGYTDRCTVVVR